MELTIRDIIGPDSNAILWWQMCIRGVVIFAYTVALIRLGDKRMFGKNTAFDIVLGIVLGSILSRGITGNSPFFPVLATSAVMVFTHWLLAVLAIHTRIGSLIKGNAQQLVKDGAMLHDEMNRKQITERDLMEAMRLNGKTQKIEEVESAYLERSGNISVITKK